MFVDVGMLWSTDTDWGAEGDDNAPDDVVTDRTPYVGYGADATFACNDAGVCDPAP